MQPAVRPGFSRLRRVEQAAGPVAVHVSRCACSGGQATTMIAPAGSLCGGVAEPCEEKQQEVAGDESQPLDVRCARYMLATRKQQYWH